jgi:lysine 2,3-aminomutase
MPSLPVIENVPAPAPSAAAGNGAAAEGERIRRIPPIAPNVLARFKPAPHPEIWKAVPDAQWNDWRWQQRERITNMVQLERVLRVTEEERVAFAQTTAEFHMGITPYYAGLMDPEDPHCPVRLQSVPIQGETLVVASDLEDPLGEEKDMPVPGVTHRYPDRVLFYLTHNCPVYCRHCTRKRKVADPVSAPAKDQIEVGLEYIEKHTEIRDVVLSGGDPLTLSDDRLDYILGRLRAMNHIEVFRLGTRNLVTLPQRVTDDFVYMVSRHQPVFVHTHFNHPKECTSETFEACRKLADAGCVLGNQMVLLKGINDDPKLVKELNHLLLLQRVRPYYIYQCDLAKGISHFRTPVSVGLDIIRALRGWTSGMAVPHFVVDAPGGGGKIPLTPDYVVSHQGKKWVLRNYAGKEYVYTEPE